MKIIIYKLDRIKYHKHIRFFDFIKKPEMGKMIRLVATDDHRENIIGQVLL